MSEAWPVTPLAAVVRLIERPEPVAPSKEYRLLGTRWYAGGLFLREIKLGHEIAAARLYRVHPGDFVYNRLFAWKGSFAVAGMDVEGSYVSNEFPCFQVDETRLSGDFLLWYFKRESAWTQALGLSSGATPTSRNRLKEELFLGMEIPLPPIDEQRRVVARIEELAAQIGEARKLRDRAVLEADAIVPAYLNRLFGDPSAGPPQVGGAWETLDAVVDDVADGPHVTPTYVGQGVPFITVLNITSGRIRFGDHKFITPDDHAQFKKRATAEKGDVLISKDGTIGVPCFVDTDREFSFFVSVALVKPRRGVLDGEFLVWALRSPYLQARMLERSRGDMIRHLVLREIRDLVVPVPSLNRQRQIAMELDNLQAKVGPLKGLQAETAAELDALLPAILDRAFKGEL